MRREREERDAGARRGGDGADKDGEGRGTFEEYREKSKAAGVM